MNTAIVIVYLVGFIEVFFYYGMATIDTGSIIQPVTSKYSWYGVIALAITWPIWFVRWFLRGIRMAITILFTLVQDGWATLINEWNDR